MLVGALVAGLPVWGFTAYVAYCVYRGHEPYLQYPYQENVDEGYLIAVGMRMLTGKMLPFVDGVAHSGPMFLYTGAFLAWFNPFSWVPVRWAALACFAGLPVLSYLAGRAAGRSLAGAVGGAAIPLFTMYWLYSNDGIPYNAEVPVIVFDMVALGAAARSTSPRYAKASAFWTAMAALFVSLAALSKQIGALPGIPITMLFLFQLLARDELSWKQKRKFLYIFAAGGLAPVVLIVGWQLARGGWRDFWYYVVVYNRDIYMTPFAMISRWENYRTWLATRPIEMALAFGSMGWGCAQLLAGRRQTTSWPKAYAHSGFAFTVALLAFTGVIGARASLREFGHYFLMPMPWIGLLVGLMVDSMGRGDDDTRSPVLIGAYRFVSVLPLIAVLEAAQLNRNIHMAQWVLNHAPFPDGQYIPPICAVIQNHAKEDTDKIFVWGFRPEYYVSCKRAPGSRFVFTTFVAGLVPWDGSSTKEREDELAVPRSRRTLMKDLQREKPKVIIDTGITTMMGRTMPRYDPLREYLDKHYTPAENIGAEQLYVRKPEPPEVAVGKK